jgi:hypothetical protein
MASPSIPERYVLLGLRLGKHLDGLIDGYFGPPELKDAVDAEEPAAPEALGEEAAALLADVEGWNEDPQRRRWLAGQVEGLVCVAELVAGTQVGWRDSLDAFRFVVTRRRPRRPISKVHRELRLGARSRERGLAKLSVLAGSLRA